MFLRCTAVRRHGRLGLGWIGMGVAPLHTSDVTALAHRMFRFSLVVIVALCLMCAIGPILP